MHTHRLDSTSDVVFNGPEVKKCVSESLHQVQGNPARTNTGWSPQGIVERLVYLFKAIELHERLDAIAPPILNSGRGRLETAADRPDSVRVSS